MSKIRKVKIIIIFDKLSVCLKKKTWHILDMLIFNFALQVFTFTFGSKLLFNWDFKTRWFCNWPNMLLFYCKFMIRGFWDFYCQKKLHCGCESKGFTFYGLQMVNHETFLHCLVFYNFLVPMYVSCFTSMVG